MISEKNILVVGTVRNCAKHLKSDVTRIGNALAGLKNVKWLLIESDSTDSTPSILAHLKNDIENFEFISLGTLQNSMHSRTERIAHCRNTYLNEIRNNSDYADIDYVAVSDFDGLNTTISQASINSCWENGDWDACTANPSGPYYDLWALRHDDWSPNDCFDQYRFHLKLNESSFKAYYTCVYARMITIPETADWIKVNSAFGGFAIYKKNAIISSEYIGLTKYGKEICEHVPLHEKMTRDGHNIFINPRLINTTRTEHIYKTIGRLILLFLIGHRGVERLIQIMRRSSQK